jgi:3-mercaptopyruvate sulfurtransferase SseA
MQNHDRSSVPKHEQLADPARRRLGLALACAGFCAPTLAGDKPATPTLLAGAQVVDVAQAHALLRQGQARFIDTRNALNYGKGHLPGAQSLPYKERSEFQADFDATLDQFDLAALGPDHHQVLVIYSDGPQGWKAYKAAVLAVRAGYKRVHYLRGGWAAWEAAGLPVAR